MESAMNAAGFLTVATVIFVGSGGTVLAQVTPTTRSCLAGEQEVNGSCQPTTRGGSPSDSGTIGRSGGSGGGAGNPGSGTSSGGAGNQGGSSGSGGNSGGSGGGSGNGGG